MQDIGQRHCRVINMVAIYQLIFKAESPIHIGYRQVGNLKTTRYYIIGRQMWGVITASLTKALFDNPKSDEYKKVGDFVKEYIKTTYFYPAIKKDEKTKEIGEKLDDYVIFLPRYTENGLKIGKLPKDEFEQYFIKSYVSTALEVNTRTAEEGSLHEFEYINNKINYENKIYNVYWIGYLIVDENGKKNGIKIKDCTNDDIIIFGGDKNSIGLKKDKVIDRIQVGGERNYGFGKLKLEKIKKTDKLFNTYQIETNESEENSKIVYLIKPTNESLIAHLELEPNDHKIKKFYGEIEAFSGMEWRDNKKSGLNVGDIKICLTPGSKLQNIRVFIDKYGILCIKND